MFCNVVVGYSRMYMIYLCVCFARSKAESPDNQVNKVTIRSKKNIHTVEC